MIKVIKRDGRVQDFVSEKIKISVANTGNDINFMLNQIDLDLIISGVEKKLMSMRGFDGMTSCFEIISLVLDELHNIGFKKVADAYYTGSFNKIGAK